MEKGKSFEISKIEVLEAFKLVKANRGAGGVDGVEIEQYEERLKDNLYKLWNRMSSGSYFPKSVRGVEIPKKDGKMRLLGIPTVEDRIVQMVVRRRLELVLEPIFLPDSYGYRPNVVNLSNFLIFFMRANSVKLRLCESNCYRLPAFFLLS